MTKRTAIASVAALCLAAVVSIATIDHLRQKAEVAELKREKRLLDEQAASDLARMEQDRREQEERDAKAAAARDSEAYLERMRRDTARRNR